MKISKLFKQVIVLSTAVVMSIGLVGCGGEAETTEVMADTEAAEATEVTADTEATEAASTLDKDTLIVGITFFLWFLLNVIFSERETFITLPCIPFLY